MTDAPRLGPVPLGLLSVAALVLAGVWWRVWPQDQAVGVDGLRWWFIRYGHAVAWAAIAVELAGRALRLAGPARQVTDAAGPVALVCYLGFLLSTFVLR